MEKIIAAANLGEEIEPLRHFWTYVGYDECNFTHMPRGMELIRKFGELESPYYFRTHHMFCTGNMHGLSKWGSTNIYIEDENGDPVYNFECIDRMIDIWLGAGCLPFFELGFMPMDLARLQPDGKPYNEGSYRRIGWSMPPKDWDKWYGLIRALAEHLLGRYGEECIRKWYFELWNEPDIMYWQGTHEEYCRLFDYTEAALHSVMPFARFGGPGTTGDDPVDSKAACYLRDFLRHCSAGTNAYSGTPGTRLDFTSFHSKGGLYNTNLRAAKQIPSVKQFLLNCRTLSTILAEEGYGDLECVVSEADPDGWAAGGRFDNFNLNFRNTEYYASWVASAYFHLQELSNSQKIDMRPLAWAFEFEHERCFEGTRAFTTQGIEKPLFNLFRSYAKLGTKRFALKTSRGHDPLQYGDLNGYTAGPEFNGWVTEREDGSFAILLYTHHDDWDIEEEFSAELQLSAFPGSEAVVRHYRIDAGHSNTYEVWKSLGSPDWPDASALDLLHRSEGLQLLCEPYTKEAEEGVLSLKFTIPAHAVSLLEVRPV